VKGHRWRARVRVQADGPAHVQTRGHSFLIDSPLGLGVRDAHPCAMDQWLGALGAELTLGLQAAVRRRGLVCPAIELTLIAELENPLVAVGVVGEVGSPAVRSIQGNCYLTDLADDADGPVLAACWDDVYGRSPILQTLLRACPVAIELKTR
jgi:hypothetical protein